MERKEIVLQPGAGQMIQSLAGKHGMNVTRALFELIDNSIDAGAAVVRFCYSRRHGTLLIKDNGKGTDHVEDIVTPFRRRDHDTTTIGQRGIGGTVAQIWLTEARGKSVVTSTTRDFFSRIDADFAAMVLRDSFASMITREPRRGQQLGTEIYLTHVRELNRQHIGSAHRELALKYTPALRRGVEIGFESDGKYERWLPRKLPAHVARIDIDEEIEGLRYRGFCLLTKPGEPNPIRGWAIGKGPRFIGEFSQPAGTEPVDLGRIYCECMLPKEYGNISDLKNEFVEEPVELWEMLGRVCAPIIERARSEGDTLAIEAATQVAQDMLDAALGYDGVRGRRPGPRGVKPGTVEPTGNGTPHSHFTYTQPGPKGGRRRLVRIKLSWASGMECPFEIRQSPSMIDFLISRDHRCNDVYRGPDTGQALYNFAAVAICCHGKIHEAEFLPLFPDLVAQSLPMAFAELCDRIQAARDGQQPAA